MNSAKRILLFLLVVYQTLGYAQPTFLNGKIRNSLDESPVCQANIKLYTYKISYTPQGIPVVKAMKDAALCAETYSNKAGNFSFPDQENFSEGYFYLKIRAENYETEYLNVFPETSEHLNNVSITLTPLHISPKQRLLLEEKNKTERMQQLAAKAADLEQILTIENTYFRKKNGLNKSKEDCQFNVPDSVYVKNLHDGYNGSGSSSGYTGFIDFDLYVSGVVQGELGGLTSNIDTKKAQAVAARTFSLNRHLHDLPVNIGQAYKQNVNESSRLAGELTSKQVVLYHGSPIDAKYAARCNGDYTQNAYEGTWNPHKNCKTSGNPVPYLISVPCAGHANCHSVGEAPCCPVKISTSGKDGYIFGHGVGLCQRGIIKFGEDQHWSYCKMLTHYYTGVCVANAPDCSQNPPPPPPEDLDCSNAVELKDGVKYAGSKSTATSLVNTYACNNWTETGPERVHRITPDKDGILHAKISDFTGDLDVYILGSCNPDDCLGEVSSSSALYRKAKAGETYYIIVDSDNGSGSAYTLLSYIDSATNIPDTTEIISSISLYPNPSSSKIYIKTENNIQITRFSVYDLTGRLLMKENLSSTKEIDISRLPKGLLIFLFSDSNNKIHSSKLHKQ